MSSVWHPLSETVLISNICFWFRAWIGVFVVKKFPFLIFVYLGEMIDLHWVHSFTVL